MSKTERVMITCPGCGKQSEFTIWQSINTMLDPEMKSAVRDRSAFLFTCPVCGASNYVDYEVLYHQMEDRIMIHYAASDESAEEICNMLTGRDMPDTMRPILEDNYLIRIVRSQNQLREKLMIFDLGLDDRIIELTKVLVLAQYREDHPDDPDLPVMLFYTEDGKCHIQIIAGEKTAGIVDLKKETYEQIKNDFSPLLPDIRSDEPFIDLDWALHTFKAKMNRR